MLYRWNQTILFLMISSFLILTWMANLKSTVNSNTLFFTSFGQCSCCLLLLSVSSTEEDTCRSKAIHVCSLLLDNSHVVSAGVMLWSNTLLARNLSPNYKGHACCFWSTDDTNATLHLLTLPSELPFQGMYTSLDMLHIKLSSDS
jgi:hypothetical protein